MEIFSCCASKRNHEPVKCGSSALTPLDVFLSPKAAETLSPSSRSGCWSEEAERLGSLYTPRCTSPNGSGPSVDEAAVNGSTAISGDDTRKAAAGLPFVLSTVSGGWDSGALLVLGGAAAAAAGQKLLRRRRNDSNDGLGLSDGVACAIACAAVFQLLLLVARWACALTAERRRAYVVGGVHATELAAKARKIREKCSRCLELHDDQVKKLHDLMESTADLRLYDAPAVDCVSAVRFLRAQLWDVGRAEQLLRASVEQRAVLMARAVTIGLTTLSGSAAGSDAGAAGAGAVGPPVPAPLEQLLRHWRTATVAGVDFDGDPIVWERLGTLDWSALMSLGEEQLMCLEAISMESLMRQLDEFTVQEQRPVHRVTMVVDLHGLPISVARPANVKVLKKLMHFDAAVYPEVLKQVLLVRAPRRFPAVWKVLETCFPERTLRKITLVPADATLSVLHRYVPARHVPRFLDGCSWWPRLTPQGRIPKKLLIRPQVAEAGGHCAALYAASATSRGGVHGAHSSNLRGRSLASLLPRHLQSGLGSLRDFREKQRAFPQSTWKVNGPMPLAHSWGVLQDISCFGSCVEATKQRPMMELLDLDIFERKEDYQIEHTYLHPALAPQHFRRQGDGRFFFIVNFMIGQYQQVAVAALPDSSASSARRMPITGDHKLSKGGAGKRGTEEKDRRAEEKDRRMWQRFLAQPPEQRWRRLRVAAVCFQGPFVVHEQLEPKRRCQLGRLQPCHGEDDMHLEVGTRLDSSEMRRLRVVFQHSYHSIVNGLAYMLAGEGPSEPPERLLFAHYCSFVDVPKLRRV